MSRGVCAILIFFFNDTATTEIYTLSLHDALPISVLRLANQVEGRTRGRVESVVKAVELLSPEAVQALASRARTYDLDRKSTRLNSSHANISYAVFCLKKKKQTVYDYVMKLDYLSS